MAVRKAPWSFAFNHNALDSSQLRCMQLLTPDTTRRCESIVPLAVWPAPYVLVEGIVGTIYYGRHGKNLAESELAGKSLPRSNR